MSDFAGPADPSATLEAIKERISAASTYGDWHQVGRDGRSLVAALEAALALPAEWEGAAASHDREAERHAGLPSAAVLSARAQALTDCAAQLREITGKGNASA